MEDQRNQQQVLKQELLNFDFFCLRDWSPSESISSWELELIFFSDQNSYILQFSSEVPLSVDHSSDIWEASSDHRYSNFQSKNLYRLSDFIFWLWFLESDTDLVQILSSNLSISLDIVWQTILFLQSLTLSLVRQELTVICLWKGMSSDFFSLNNISDLNSFQVRIQDFHLLSFQVTSDFRNHTVWVYENTVR